MSDFALDRQRSRVLESVDEIEPGMVLEVPALRRIGGRAWMVEMVTSRGFSARKLSGSSEERVHWDEEPGGSTYDPQNRSIRELVHDGEVVFVGWRER